MHAAPLHPFTNCDGWEATQVVRVAGKGGESAGGKSGRWSESKKHAFDHLPGGVASSGSRLLSGATSPLLPRRRKARPGPAGILSQACLPRRGEYTKRTSCVIGVNMHCWRMRRGRRTGTLQVFGALPAVDVQSCTSCLCLPPRVSSTQRRALTG